jgi:hypothetical protein
VRLFAIVTGFVLLAACDSQPRQGSLAERDETQAAWYAQVVKQVAAINREAESDFKAGKADRASALIQEAQPLVARLLAVRHPNLAAAEVASDLDQLYGQMLMSNRHYAWARLMFQKNLSRWKHWSPQTPDTERRYKEAEAAIAECDKHTD